MSVLFVDGWFAPDPGDRQELWAEALPEANATRLAQDDWERPPNDTEVVGAVA